MFRAPKGGGGKSTFTMLAADVLNNAQIVDHDPQGTIRNISRYTGRHVPVAPEEFSGDFLLHDMPPYNCEGFKSLMREVDLVVIPVKLAAADLLAAKGVVDELRELGQTSKGILVFNEVRRPDTRVQQKMRGYFQSNYTDIRKAVTEISSLSAFRDIMETPLSGRAREEAEELVNEFLAILKAPRI